MAFAKGKYAKAISDRSGMEFPYREMVKEWNGSFVHISEYEAKQPQLEIRTRGGDAQGLRDARPARTENEVARMLEPNPFETIVKQTPLTETLSPTGYLKKFLILQETLTRTCFFAKGDGTLKNLTGLKKPISVTIPLNII